MSSEFYDEYINSNKAIIYKICKAYARDEEEFQDYFQEVCLQLWKSRDRFNHNSKLSTWIYRVALNVCLTLVRNEQAKGAKVEVTETHLKDHRQEDNEQSRLEALYASIRKLKEVDRGLILLYLDGKSYKEIAEITGITVSNVGAKVNRIKTQLKKEANEIYEH
ncbi:MAG: sigma-70 family RNA polymerase sigma factor [Bacteroidota bacterium]